MRKGTLWMMGMLLAGLGACAHDTSSTSALEAPRDRFADAYDAVKSGAKETAQAGGLYLKQTGEGAVSVVSSAYTPTRRYVEDGWITTRIKSQYATDPNVKSTRVHVRTDNGVVTLRGTVDSSFQAEAAIRRALETPGVIAVSSELQFPEQHNQARTYTPSPHVRVRE